MVKKQSNRSPFQLIFWLIGIVAVGLVVFMIVDNQSKAASTEPIVIDDKGQPVLGDSSATVQILEFGDYKCPYCKSFAASFFPKIKEDFIDTGKAQFHFMNDDFISVDSTRSAEFAEVVYQELGNDVYWKFHELLYSKQPDGEKYEKEDYFTEEFLIETLGGIASAEEVAKVKTSFQEGNGKESLEVDHSYVELLNVASTPTLFINGKQFTGSTYDDFVEMVEEELQ